MKIWSNLIRNYKSNSLILTKLNKYKCCDESNNTPDVISRNQLVVDVFIRPTFVAEFIHLKFTNAGTNSLSTIIGGA